MRRTLLCRELLQGRAPGFSRVLQLGADHRLPEWANPNGHRLMIKEIPDQRGPLFRPFALVQRPGSRRTSCQHWIALSPFVKLPVIKEHRHIGPRSAMITYRERMLSVGAD